MDAVVVDYGHGHMFVTVTAADQESITLQQAYDRMIPAQREYIAKQAPMILANIDMQRARSDAHFNEFCRLFFTSTAEPTVELIACEELVNVGQMHTDTPETQNTQPVAHAVFQAPRHRSKI